MASTKHTAVTVMICYINLGGRAARQSTQMQPERENNKQGLTGLLLATPLVSQEATYLDSGHPPCFQGEENPNSLGKQRTVNLRVLIS